MKKFRVYLDGIEYVHKVPRHVGDLTIMDGENASDILKKIVTTDTEAFVLNHAIDELTIVITVEK